MLVHQCHSSIISSDFRDYSWLRLGLGVGKCSRLDFWIKMLFQGQQNMFTKYGTHLTQKKSGCAAHQLRNFNLILTLVNDAPHLSLSSVQCESFSTSHK